MLTVYGIPNCDTVKKARAWLSSHDVAYQFHDYKKQGVPEDILKQALKNLGYERLVNRQGQTWRKLSDTEKNAVTSNASALVLMVKQPSVIKRPLLQVDGQWLAGFEEKLWRHMFKKAA